MSINYFRSALAAALRLKRAAAWLRSRGDGDMAARGWRARRAPQDEGAARVILRSLSPDEFDAVIKMLRLMVCNS